MKPAVRLRTIRADVIRLCLFIVCFDRASERSSKKFCWNWNIFFSSAYFSNRFPLTLYWRKLFWAHKLWSNCILRFFPHAYAMYRRVLVAISVYWGFIAPHRPPGIYSRYGIMITMIDGGYPLCDRWAGGCMMGIRGIYLFLVNFWRVTFSNLFECRAGVC